MADSTSREMEIHYTSGSGDEKLSAFQDENFASLLEHDDRQITGTDGPFEDSRTNENTSNSVVTDTSPSNRELCPVSVSPGSDHSIVINTEPVELGDNRTTHAHSKVEPVANNLTDAMKPYSLHLDEAGRDGVNNSSYITDLNSIICELERISTEGEGIRLTASGDEFQDSAKHAVKGLSPDASAESDKLQFLSGVMDDLTLMAESIDIDSNEAPNQIKNVSSILEEAVVHHNSSSEKSQENLPDEFTSKESAENSPHSAGSCQNKTSSDNLSRESDYIQNLSEVDSMEIIGSESPLNIPEKTNLLHNLQNETDDLATSEQAATVARKRYASMKSKKINSKQGTHLDDDSPALDVNKDADFPQIETKQHSIVEQKNGIGLTQTLQHKKTNSEGLNVKKSHDDALTPQSLSEQTDCSFGTSTPEASSNIHPDQSAKSLDPKILHIMQLGMKRRTRADSLEELAAKDDGATNFAFVASPHVAEVHAARGATGGASNIEEEAEDDDVPLDMEQLLRKLDLSDKVKKQIRQASQLSFQLQSKPAEKRSKLDMKRWKSLDSAAHNRTSPPSPSADAPSLTKLKPWKIPLAIKMMKNLRKKQSSIEEDRLSLEFFVPGKKTIIRLHRRTFFNFLLKYSIFFFTFIFWIGSLSCISYGAWMLTHSSAIIDNVSDVFLDPYVLLCVVGAIIFVIAFVGCLGALRENIYLLKIFQYSLTAVVALEVLLCTLVFLFYTMPEFRRAVKVGPEEVLKSAVKRYFDDDSMKTWIDTVQKEFRCCGVSMSDNGYLDWQENPYFNCSESNPSMHRCSVPLSCCIFEDGDYINYMCGAGIIKEEPNYVRTIINTKGCMKSFGEWLAKHDAAIGFVALGLIGLQILGVVSGRYFIKNLRESDSTKRQSDRIQIGPSESG